MYVPLRARSAFHSTFDTPVVNTILSYPNFLNCRLTAPSTLSRLRGSIEKHTRRSVELDLDLDLDLSV